MEVELRQLRVALQLVDRHSVNKQYLMRALRPILADMRTQRELALSDFAERLERAIDHVFDTALRTAGVSARAS